MTYGTHFIKAISLLLLLTTLFLSVGCSIAQNIQQLPSDTPPEGAQTNSPFSAKKCSTCNGSKQVSCSICGATGKSKCYTCGGLGQTSNFESRTCTSCGGSGRTFGTNICYGCSGMGTSYQSVLRPCYACSGLSSKTCTSCGGDGKTACSACAN